MSVYSTEYHAMVSSPSQASESLTVSANRTGDQDEGFFHHLLDVVNPLQHLPVIGTVYRAMTGEHIGAVEKIAGDTLYGGLWGAISSVADLAFEGITGKSAEDTVIGWIKGDSNSQVAKITPPSITVAQSLPSSDTPTLPSSPAAVASTQSNSPDIVALSAALSSRGITGDMASRALDAYRRAVSAPQSTPILAVAN
jgi:hypothetical protein